MSPSVEKSIDIHVPVHTAYRQWTQFESFPRFLEGVVEVRRLSDTRLSWTARVAGRKQEWEAEIVEQQPDRRVAWKALNGARDAGAVTFHRISDRTTRVMLQLEGEPEGLFERAGDRLAVFAGRVQGDLQRFKELVESRATGTWRGGVTQKHS